jgi:hypothetical protein
MVAVDPERSRGVWNVPSLKDGLAMDLHHELDVVHNECMSPQ